MITRNVDILSDETRSVLEDMPEYLIIYSYVKRTDSFTLTLITNELFSHLGGNRKKLRDFYDDHQDDFIYGPDYDYLVQTMKKAMSNPTSTYKIVLRLMTSMMYGRTMWKPTTPATSALSHLLWWLTTRPTRWASTTRRFSRSRCATISRTGFSTKSSIRQISTRISAERRRLTKF